MSQPRGPPAAKRRNPAFQDADILRDGSSDVRIEFDVPATMRDGTVLRADVYRPSGPGPWPTLLTRAPYGKTLPTVLGWLDPVKAACRGFMVVVQDTRGRYASEGRWEPFRYERDDGFDSVEWAARLPGSSGRVGMYGTSYFGNTQWLAALEQPPSLGAIAPALTWADPMDGLFARGGAVELGLSVPWALQTGFDHLDRRLRTQPEELRQRIAAAIDEHDRLGDAGYWELPVEQATVASRHGVPELGSARALVEPAVADWCRVDGSHDLVQVPTFHIAGWHDVFLQGTLDNFEAMSARRSDARLIVGPWTHDTFVDPIGDRIFGLRAGKDGVAVHPHGDIDDMQLAWSHHHLASDSSVALADAPVRIFVMGRNSWRDEPTWPPARARNERWFLHASGELATRPPKADDPPGEFVYDPLNPVPTLGGHILLSPGHRSGPIDQARIEARDDVLVFTSDPLPHELEVTGRVRAILHASSSAPSTDWVVRVCDVQPDGRSLNVCDGILRVHDGAQALLRHEIDLWSTSIVFMAGHRIRVHVTSSCFPRWDRNLNTGDQSISRHQLARQRIHHDQDRPSYVELPVIA